MIRILKSFKDIAVVDPAGEEIASGGGAISSGHFVGEDVCGAVEDPEEVAVLFAGEFAEAGGAG